MNRNDFQYEARQFRAGRISLNQFTDRILGRFSSFPPEQDSSTADALVMDTQRPQRCGYPEVIYGPGKTLQSLCTAVETLVRHDQPVLVTRIDGETGSSLVRRFPQGRYCELAGTFRLSRAWQPDPDQPLVGIITAGTADRGVAHEALETLCWMEQRGELVVDVGVAGPQRLLPHLPLLRQCQAVIVVAGADGALPSVVAGHVPCPVIAVPTSVGYGTSFGGLAALLTMLNSCAANVAVVNIDAGFKAGYLAGMIASRCRVADTPLHHANTG